MDGSFTAGGIWEEGEDMGGYEGIWVAVLPPGGRIWEDMQVFGWQFYRRGGRIWEDMRVFAHMKEDMGRYEDMGGRICDVCYPGEGDFCYPGEGRIS